MVFVWSNLVEPKHPKLVAYFPVQLFTIFATTVNQVYSVFLPLLESYRQDQVKWQHSSSVIDEAPTPSSSPLQKEAPGPDAVPSSDLPIDPFSPTPSEYELKLTMTSFMHVLETPALFREFKKIAVADFNVENPLFWEEYTSFRHGIGVYLTDTSTFPHPFASSPPLPPHLARTALGMYTTFVAPNAPLQLNLSCRVSDPVIKIFKKPLEEGSVLGDVFAEVADEVVWTMFGNTYVKFLEKRS
ncbi:hypothetical protein HKX48_000514 [Thoreauomyces humboldtii]|nr:hypothetical protein HKX48_000514 [Thoreauomyces humboldtii]